VTASSGIDLIASTNDASSANASSAPRTSWAAPPRCRTATRRTTDVVAPGHRRIYGRCVLRERFVFAVDIVGGTAASNTVPGSTLP
jgi:hypothetical protein